MQEDNLPYKLSIGTDPNWGNYNRVLDSEGKLIASFTAVEDAFLFVNAKFPEVDRQCQNMHQ